MYFDRFDICEAWYAYAVDWHGGKHGDIYRIFGRLRAIWFNPSTSVREHGYDALTDNGRDIYDALVARNTE
jgi:hypothetical protein